MVRPDMKENFVGVSKKLNSWVYVASVLWLASSEERRIGGHGHTGNRECEDEDRLCSQVTTCQTTLRIMQPLELETTRKVVSFGASGGSKALLSLCFQISSP